MRLALLAWLLLTAPLAGAAPLECVDWQNRHPQWLWCDDFEDDARLETDYFEVRRAGGRFGVSDEDAWGGSHAARVDFETGVVGHGGLKRAFGRNPVAEQGHASEDFDEVYWRFHVKMEPGWVGQPYKVTRATSFARSDWSQAMIAHIWGGSGSLGMALDPATGVEGDQVVTQGYNDFANLRWLGARSGPRQVYAPAEVGVWVCVEARVKLNTPGLLDGVFEFWFDGVLQASRADLDWRGSYTGHGVNAIFLENYWNGGAPRNQQRYFDNLVISRQPIGCFDPGGSSGPPATVDNLRIVNPS